MERKKGFTLLEMIIAVGLLSIMSVGILKVFLAAKDLNDKSEDLYNSMLLTKNIVSLMDGGKFPGDKTNEYMSQFYVDRQKKGPEGKYTLFLNESFQPIKESSPEESSPYVWEMNVREMSEKAYSESGLYDVDIQVYRHKPYVIKEKEPDPIYEVSMKRFFAGMGE